MAPIWLNIRHSVELPDNFQNTGLIKVKGTRRRGERVGNTQDFFYREEIIVDKVLWAKDILLEDYLKKQPKEKPLVNKPYEGEGFLEYKQDYTIFHPKKDNTLYPPCNVVIEGKIPDAYLQLYKKMAQRKDHYRDDYPLVKIKGYYSQRKKGELYYEVRIKEIISLDTTQTLNDFKYKPQTKRIENIEYFEEEGFYSKGLEHSAFTVLKEGSLKEGTGWVYFEKHIQDIDSIKYITQHKSPDLKRGVYMKVKGIKQTGSSYGHFGMGDYQLYISKIIAIDSSRNRWVYMIDKIDKTGFYNGKRIVYPDILKEGKEYNFIGQGRAYFNEYDSTRVDIDSIYDVKLKVRRKGAYLNYHYTVSYEGKVLKTEEGQNIMNMYAFFSRDESMETTTYYEAISRKKRYYDQSVFNIRVWEDRDELGRLNIIIEDDAKYGTAATLYEQTN